MLSLLSLIYNKARCYGAGREGNRLVKYRTNLSTILLSPFLTSVSDYNKLDSMSKELLLQHPSQTQREPDMETEIDCPHCYDIMTLSYDFDKLYYFCEECNLSLLIN
jgi:hypothetical protein